LIAISTWPASTKYMYQIDFFFLHASQSYHMLSASLFLFCKKSIQEATAILNGLEQYSINCGGFNGNLSVSHSYFIYNS